MSFLKAEWRKLALVNYKVDPKLLEAYLPYGTEIDKWKGNCFISLVGFMFVNTKILGVRVPFHINFEEVNLRFYVKRSANGNKRGVVFLKEIVPRHAITFVANHIYKEHYQTLSMKHQWQVLSDHKLINYAWKIDKRWNNVLVTTELDPLPAEAGSDTEFITEHYWGYAKVNDHHTFEYEVKHPKWLHYPVLGCHINVDFGITYGKKFAFLNKEKPASVMLAEGSSITVGGKSEIKKTT